MALGALFAVMLIGLIGPTGAVVDLSTGPKEMVFLGGNIAKPMECIECDPLAALYGFNKDVSLEGWGAHPNAMNPYLGATAYNSRGDVIDSIFQGDGLWYPSVAQLNMRYMESDKGVMDGAVATQAAAQKAEYDANPLNKKGRPIFLYEPDTSMVPHKMS